MLKYIILAGLLTSAAANAASLKDINPYITVAVIGVSGLPVNSITNRLIATNDNDVIEVVTLVEEGGNGFSQYLVNAHESDTSVLVTSPILVGTGFDFSVDSISIDGNKVILTGNQWAEGDAHCCPTINTTRTYILENHLFKQDKK